MGRRKMLRKITIVSMLLSWVLPAGWVSSSSTVMSAQVALSGERIMHSSPATADLDGDGDKEIVIGGKDGKLYVIAYNQGTWSVVWERQTANDLVQAGAPTSSPCVSAQSDIRSAPAVGDLDNDGHQDIVISTGGDVSQHRNGGILVYRYNSRWSFSVLPGWPQPKLDKVGAGAGSGYPDGCWDGIWSTPALGDLDDDGDLEVVVEGFDRHIWAWHHNGQPVAGWPIYRYTDETNQIEGEDCLLRGGWSSPAIGDIDNDGLPEVVVGTDSPPWNCPANWDTIDYSRSTVWAINGDSSNVPGWPVVTEQTIQSSPALGDIDGDGDLEVVVGTGQGIAGTGGHKVYAWQGNGQPVSGWPRPTGANMWASPALGDLDGDGDLEVVVGCGTETDTSCNWLYAWQGNGSNVPGFPMSPPSNSKAGYAGQGLPYSPGLADYDGDGNVEILIGHTNSYGVAAIDSQGHSENNPALVTANTLMSSPVVDDVDNDGKLEVVVGGASDGTNSHGGVYVWDVAGAETAQRPWPMFHQNVRRSGVGQFCVSGRVTDVNGLPFAGANAWMDGQVSVSNSQGLYRFTGKGPGTYTVVPQRAGCAFVPPDRTVTLPPNAGGQDFVILPEPVSTSLSPSSAGSISFDDTQGLPTGLAFPRNAVGQTTTVVVTPTFVGGHPGFAFAGHAFELAAFQGGYLQDPFFFGQPVGVSITYSNQDVVLVTSESALVLKWWTGSGWQDAAQTCSPPSSYQRDLTNQEIEVAICRTGLFALFGPTNQVYMPVVTKDHLR